VVDCDALTAQLEGNDFSTLLIIQSFRPNWLFSTEQQQRLSELMNLWRTARIADSHSLQNNKQT
jgi:hypothetical protein